MASIEGLRLYTLGWDGDRLIWGDATVVSMVEGVERLADEMAASEDRWRTPVFAVDEDWRFTYLNDTAERLFESSARKLEGKSVWPEIAEPVRDTYRETFEAAIEASASVETEIRCPRRQSWFRVRAYPLATGVSVHLEDLSGRLRRELELELREQALRDAHEITTDRRAGTRTKVQRLLGLVRATLGTELATLSRVDPDAGAYRFLAADADEDAGPLPVNEQVPLMELPNCAEVVRTEQTIALHDVDEQAPELSDPTWGIQAYLGAPVWMDEELYGTFCFYSTERRSQAFSDWEVTYVDLFSDWVGTELERAGGWPEQAQA